MVDMRFNVIVVKRNRILDLFIFMLTYSVQLSMFKTLGFHFTCLQGVSHLLDSCVYSGYLISFQSFAANNHIVGIILLIIGLMFSALAIAIMILLLRVGNGLISVNLCFLLAKLLVTFKLCCVVYIFRL